MTVAKELLEILACPECKGELTYQENPEQLQCPSCRLKYRVKDGIPIMLKEDAESY